MRFPTEEDTALSKETFIDSAGILREVEPVVKVYNPDMTVKTIFEKPVTMTPEPKITEPVATVPVTINIPAPSSEEDSTAYQEYMRQVAMIAALQNPNVTVIPSDVVPFNGSTPAPVTEENLTPQVQFIGMDEFIAISDEGIILPKSETVIVVPISEIKEPELFNAVVVAKIEEPQKPMNDIILDEVVKPLEFIPRLEGETLAQSADEIKNIILFQNDIVELKIENPGLTIVECTLIAAETQPSDTAIEEVTKKVDEIVTMQQENGVSNNSDQQQKAKEKLEKNIYKLSFLDKVVEYIYKSFYSKN